MKIARESWPLSSVLLLLSGVALIPVGLYFVLMRPPLLPEDLRYIGKSLAQLEAGAPHLTAWLRYVFRVMGGYVIATGVLTIALATTSFRDHHWGAAAGALWRGSSRSEGW